jgi:hypothetical protein
MAYSSGNNKQPAFRLSERRICEHRYWLDEVDVSTRLLWR